VSSPVLSALERDCSSTRVITLRCHRCSYFIGEDSESMELVGVVKEASLRKNITPPRRSWMCPKCRWTNIFRPFTEV
jgi:hypothetical protein